MDAKDLRHLTDHRDPHQSVNEAFHRGLGNEVGDPAIRSRPKTRKNAPTAIASADVNATNSLEPCEASAPTVTPEIAWLMGLRWVCRSEKAIRELDYRTVPLREMLEDCHRWMVAEGRLNRRCSRKLATSPG